MDLFNLSSYRWPRRPGVRFLFRWLLMSPGGSRWFFHRREGQCQIRGLVIPVISEVPHLEAGVLMVGVILPGHFIKHFRLHTVL